MRQNVIWLAVLLSAASAGRSSASTIRVPDDQPTIQAGIDAASYGDTVLVACGRYEEYQIHLRPGICLAGESNDPTCAVIWPANGGRVLNCVDCGDSLVIRDLTIRGGVFLAGGAGLYCVNSSPRIENVIFMENHSWWEGSGSDGGGLYCEYSSPTLVDVVFESNIARSDGGGMYCYYSTPSLQNVTFDSNAAVGHAGNPGGNGGGLCLQHSDALLVDVVFLGNSADDSEGGGMHCDDSAPILENVAFDGNHAYHGGGLFCQSYTSPVLTDVILTGNTAIGAGGGFHGVGSSPSLTRVVFDSNVAGSNGGGLYANQGEPHLVSCTFYGNSASTHGGAVFAEGYQTNVILDDCVIAFSEHGEGVFTTDSSSATVACCDVYGNAGGEYGGNTPDLTGLAGNISDDPLFCDPSDGDFMIHETSPCAPANNSCGVLIGAYGVGCGASALQSMTWGAIKAEYRQ